MWASAKRISQPDFGSLEASCSIEVAFDPSLIFDDVAGFRIRAKQAYTACRRAVDDELTRQQAMAHEATTPRKDAVRPTPSGYTQRPDRWKS